MDKYIGNDFIAIASGRVSAGIVGMKYLYDTSETAMEFLQICSDDEFFRTYYLNRKCVWFFDEIKWIMYIISILSAELFAHIIEQYQNTLRRLTLEISDRYRSPINIFMAISMLDGPCKYKSAVTKEPVPTYKLWELDFCRYSTTFSGDEVWMYHTPGDGPKSEIPV